MPLKIIPSRSKKAKTKTLYIRGSHLGTAVDVSARTDRLSLAKKVVKRIEGEIERGEYGKRQPAPSGEQPTFLNAAIAYLKDGHRKRYVQRLIDYFEDTLLSEIDQAAIDKCAQVLHPNVTACTRNTCVYTPISAILKHAGVKTLIVRPKGSKGKRRTNWFTPPDAFGVITAAEAIDPEFATLLVSLLYTGPRIGAALDVQREDLQLEEGTQWARPQKGQEAHAVTLHSELRERFAQLLATHDRRKVFRWRYGGHLQWLLLRAKLSYLGIPCPAVRPRKGWREPPNRLKGYTFHTWRHTCLTWFRRYAKVPKGELLGLGTHKDERSLDIYLHAAPDPAWDRVEQFPAMTKKVG